MRPISRPQSALLAPLNSLLGTEASVRILRVLTTGEGTLNLAELARRAELRPSTVRHPIQRLASHGMVDLVGTGSRQLVQWRAAHPLADAIRGLFVAEARRTDRMRSGLLRAISTLSPPPVAAWIEPGSDGMLPALGDPLTIGVLVRDGSPPLAADTLRVALLELEQAEEVTIEIRMWTVADLAVATTEERARLTRCVALYGPPPISPPKTAGGAPARDHQKQDTRSLALAAAVARKLATDRGLIARTREQLAERIPHASPGEQRTLREWQQILESMSWARLQRFLVDPGERATRLRQSLPFLGVLSPAERQAALAHIAE